MGKQNGLGNVVGNVREVAGKMVSEMIEAISDSELSDAIAILKNDHAKVKALFAQADALSDTAYAARLKLFKEIDAALTLHTTLEETIFYPAFKAKTERNTDERDEVLEAFEEHAGAKDLIAKLERLDVRDETYKAKLQVLGEMIRHHVEEEESEGNRDGVIGGRLLRLVLIPPTGELLRSECVGVTGRELRRQHDSRAHGDP